MGEKLSNMQDKDKNRDLGRDKERLRERESLSSRVRYKDSWT